jgi:Holliday junction DNA helicase RuvA
MQARENEITLYGFLEPADRVWFRMLQTVQGVGARVALSLLGVLRPPELATAIAIGDKAGLTRASGVGARLAGRIVSELKDRVGAGVPTKGGARSVSPAAPHRWRSRPLWAGPRTTRSRRSSTWATAAATPSPPSPASRHAWRRRHGTTDQLIREALKELAA